MSLPFDACQLCGCDKGRKRWKSVEVDGSERKREMERRKGERERCVSTPNKAHPCHMDQGKGLARNLLVVRSIIRALNLHSEVEVYLI